MLLDVSVNTTQRLLDVIVKLLSSGNSLEFAEVLQLVLDLADALSKGLVDGEHPLLLSDTLNSDKGIGVSVGKNDDMTISHGNVSVHVVGAPLNVSTTVIVWSGGTHILTNQTVVTVKTGDSGNVEWFVSSTQSGGRCVKWSESAQNWVEACSTISVDGGYRCRCTGSGDYSIIFSNIDSFVDSGSVSGGVIAAIVVAIVLALTIAALIAIWRVPALRHKIFPYDRKIASTRVIPQAVEMDTQQAWVTGQPSQRTTINK